MVRLTKDAWRALKYISAQPVNGPAPGWNADCELAPDGHEPMDGTDLQTLFNLGLLSAIPIPPPHSEDFNEEAGSIVRDHEWVITPAGRAALADHGGGE
jgi:hypothetical protein